MSNPSNPSFSSSRRWLLRLNFFLALVALVALLVMVNYLAGGYFKRFQVGANISTRLSPQTLRILGSLTNEVTITIFFDPESEPELYSLTSSLLAEYHNACPKHISVSTLDYTRFDGEARQLLSRHSLMAHKDKDKNFVLFECNSRSKIYYSKSLADYDINEAIASGGKVFRRNAFRGEMLFTSAIFAVNNPQPPKSLFLVRPRRAQPAKPLGRRRLFQARGHSQSRNGHRLADPFPGRHQHRSRRLSAAHRGGAPPDPLAAGREREN